ncbi:chitobiase/beta-hexosaminidase C-terminal domain-containing protein [Candidatus Sumerlaeota bacterium]|nr:chitobiase/beta-hexosaminidase C-terminal domain-containing protein [Candidatus Sumerlaeota bacterium]
MSLISKQFPTIGVLLALAWTALPAPSHAARFPAFPGAEGFGAYTPGGRGGKVLLVTTIEDYKPGKEKPIPGSLREAVMAKFPRTILFRVSGNIRLKEDLKISEPFISIAGQTAPGDGICLRDYPLTIKTHDVVLRYLRVRPGDTMKKEMDAISCDGQNVIIDHCSASWGIDETLSVTSQSSDVTVQWCMITESLNDSYHKKGPHGYGSLINGAGPITFHHNLYAFHRSRNPRPGDVYLDFRNNVIYGWLDRAGYCGDNVLRMNYVANYLKPGPQSKDREYAFSPGGADVRIYIYANYFVRRVQGAIDGSLLIRPFERKEDGIKIGAKDFLVATEYPSATVFTAMPEDAYLAVLKEGGATLPARDAVDSRVMKDVREGKGKIINSQNDVDGWPELKSADPPMDTDGDGMSDEWEKQYNLNPADASDNARDADNDGFTNIEEYINGTDPLEHFPWIVTPDIFAGGVMVDREYDFTDPAIVELKGAAAGSEIRYTLDGSEPQANSPQYSAPLTVDKSLTLRAKIFHAGHSSHETFAVFTRQIPREPDAPANLAAGLRYEYYEAGEWNEYPRFEKLKPAASGVTPALDLSARKSEGPFGFRFTGFITIPRDGIYTFYSRSNERNELFIGDAKVVESKGRDVRRAGRIALKAGGHKFTDLVYYPYADKNELEILYEGPGIEKQPIPASAWRHQE